MIGVKDVGTLLIGMGTGLGIGYMAPNLFKPSISIASGGVWTFSGFPANSALMSMGGGTSGIGSAPTSIGQTDANGKLVITGAPTIPAGNTVLYVVFVAANPEIFATTIVKS